MDLIAPMWRPTAPGAAACSAGKPEGVAEHTATNEQTGAKKKMTATIAERNAIVGIRPLVAFIRSELANNSSPHL
jgi:hypothetical protein